MEGHEASSADPPRALRGGGDRDVDRRDLHRTARRRASHVWRFVFVVLERRAVAAHFGIPYCFAHFITDGEGVEQALSLYRNNYKPSERLPEPKATVCIWALAADTMDEAEYLFSSRAYNKVRRSLGDLRPIVAPENIDWDALSEGERRHRDRLRETAIVGDGRTVAGQLGTLADRLGLDEMVVLTWTHSQ